MRRTNRREFVQGLEKMGILAVREVERGRGEEGGVEGGEGGWDTSTARQVSAM